MEYIDQPGVTSFHNRFMSPQTAFMMGKIQTDNVDDLLRFQQVFPFNPQAVLDVAEEVKARFEAKEVISNRDKADTVFLELLPKCFLADRAADWEANLHVNVTDVGEYSVEVSGGVANIRQGLRGTPTSTVTMDYDTFSAVLKFEVLEDANQLDQVNYQGEDLDAELSDDQLEAVAGGKGGCGAEGAAGTACGADYCGAAGSAGTACGAAACAAAAGAGAACGGDACGAAVGAGTACGGAACGAAAGAGTACGADACGAAAGAGTACGAAACGAAACAGDICGAAVGSGVCAGNVCGADVLAGVDYGPCAINVIPAVPFI